MSLDHGIGIIKSHLKSAPTAPGVYRMLSESGEVLYVGKAKSIKQRVTSYTQPKRLTTRLIKMVSATRSMVFVTTRTESEALLLEASLIKRWMPRYNVLLKDDKSFPYILLREDHEWAQITKHRGARKTGGRYYGPFASAHAVYRTLNTLQKVFQLRSCSDSVFENRTRACMLHQIKRCSAPCVNKISVKDYARTVAEAAQFLEGRSSDIQKQLADRMQEASTNMEYEQAAVFRDRLAALTQIQSHQNMVNAMIDEADVIAAAKEGGQVGIQVFFFRNGQNWGHRAYFPKHDANESIEDVMTAFIGQFYDNKPVAKTLLLSHALNDSKLLEKSLSENMGYKVSIMVPKRGPKADTVAEATRNARESLERKLAETAGQAQLLTAIAEVFHMPDMPQRVEVYDNSHIQGTNAIGAMIVAGPDGFIKKSYRKFNIDQPAGSTAPTGGDDFAMMREVMERRFKRLQQEDPNREKEGNWPDLLLIDGGRGQLSSVHSVLDDLGIEDITVVGISKGEDRDAGREQFHMRGHETFMLPGNDKALFFLQRLRDEAHRFAISSHRARRKKNFTKSPLDDLPGIGAKRKKALLLHFGSAKAVAGADVRDLAHVEGISKALAQKIYDHFHD